jgi:hypothetical protein
VWYLDNPHLDRIVSAGSHQPAQWSQYGGVLVHAENDFARCQGRRGEDETVEYEMRRDSQQGRVFVAARIAFASVAHDDWSYACLQDRTDLASSGKSGSTATPQSRRGDQVSPLARVPDPVKGEWSVRFQVRVGIGRVCGSVPVG